jgi:eukaryotic-like serine/threonine-protein kinase
MNLPDRQRWAQLSPVLEELLELDATGRQARLSELRASDGTMADELESMVSANDRAEGCNFLAGDAQGESAAPATLVGERIGAYLIEASLGQGGTGSVWRARRVDGRFEGAVAIKLLHLSLIGRAGALRFEREGAILARLTHPNIARLLDAGVTPSGQPYLVLDLVDGQRIDHHCDTLRLDVKQRLALFDAVLAAVAHAHSHLVIHRDIKPTNILVSADGHVKLLDFGIAKLLEDGVQGSPVTAEGQRALTPEYAAPEQLQGASVTTATDVYALGVLLYQLLTGRHPTAPDTASSAEVMRATLATDPLRMSSALTLPGAVGTEAPMQAAAARNTSLPRLHRLLQGDLENIVARTLRKSPSERYQTIAALAEDLRRFRADEPVSARPDSLAYRCAKFVRRRRGAVAAGLVIVLAVAAGVAGTVAQARRAEVQAQQALYQRDRALHELAGAEAMEEFMTVLLASRADKPFTVSELLLRGEALARRQFEGDAALRARLLWLLSNLTYELAEQDRTMELLRQAQSAVAGTDEKALGALIDCSIATVLAGEPDAAKAAAMFAAALRVVAGDGDGEERSVHAVCLHLRASRARETGDAQTAIRDGRAALEMLAKPRPGQRSTVLSVRMNLAGALANSGELAEGISQLKQAIEEMNALGRGQEVAGATFLNNLGVLLDRAGDTLGALDAYEKAVKIEGATPVSARLPMHVAKQLLAVGRPQEATDLFERARTLAAQRGDVLGLALGTVEFNYCPAGQAARCDQRLAEARLALDGLLPPQHPTFGALETTVAELAVARDDLQPAHAALQRALAIFDNAPGLQPVRTRAAAMQARIELDLGHADAAATHAAEAVSQARTLAKGFEHSRWLGSALVAQGMVQQSRGESAAAQATWRAALTELTATVGDSAPATAEARRLLAGA